MIGNRTGAIIAAAGGSLRMGFDKLRANLGGIPVLARAITAFEACPEVHEIVLVMSIANLEWGRSLVTNFGWTKVTSVCLGGARRQESVLRGLEQLPDCRWVLIHDGARPFVDGDMITRGLKEAAQVGAAVAAVPVKDTIKVVDEKNFVISTPDRASLWAAQTPEVFRGDLILEAFRGLTAEVTDDAQVLELAGKPVKVFPGSYDNIKITTPEDLVVAEAILGRRMERGM